MRAMQLPADMGSHLSMAPGKKTFWLAAILAFGAFFAFAGAEAAQLSLSWKDNSDNESGFEVERSSDGVSFSALDSVGADVTAFVDTSVLPGLPYHYRVRAFNEFGYSGYTNVVVAELLNTPPSVLGASTVSALSGLGSTSVALQLSDGESDASNLLVEVESSSNTTLLPLSGIAISGSGAEREVVLSPVSGRIGSATVKLVVSDGVATSTHAFTITVLANTAPTISSVAAKQVLAGLATAPIGFTVGDAETAAGDLSVTATASDESLIAEGGLVLGGTGSARTLKIFSRSGVSGSTNISISVSDGASVVKRTFALTVNANTAPTITQIADQSIGAFASLTGLRFSIGDAQTAAENLTLRVTSSNTTLLPVSGIAIGGTGDSRVLGLHPVQYQSGVSDVSIYVSDGVNESEESFRVTVEAPSGAVDIVSYRIVENGVALIEVLNRPGSSFTLWQTHTLAPDSWEMVEDVIVQAGSKTTLIRVGSAVESSVCYRVKATLE